MKQDRKTFTTKLDINHALYVEQELAKECFQMRMNGFPLDVEEVGRQIYQLQERVDWVDNAILPFIPPAPNKKGVPVEEPFKMNGQLKKAVVDWYEEDSDQVEGPFSKIEWVPINLDSSKQVNKWLLDNGWVPTEWNCKKDKRGKEIKDSQGNRIPTSPKITEDSLESLEELGPAGRLIAYRRKCTHKRNQLKGFLRELRPDGTVPSKVNTLGAATRRMTHSIIANVPGNDKKGKFWKTMRKCFYAGDDEHVVVGADASQIQIRGLAHYAYAVVGDDTYIIALKKSDSGEGPDIHTVNASISGTSRSDGKGIFYGYLFGAGIPKTASQLGKSEAATRKIRKKFDEGLPFIQKLLEYLIGFYRANGYITGLDGTKIFVPSEHMLLVYLLQNFEVVIMKWALVFAMEEVREAGLDCKLVTFQHDEFQFVAHKRDAEHVGKILEESLEKAGTFVGSTCPIVGEAKIGKTWYDTH